MYMLTCGMYPVILAATFDSGFIRSPNTDISPSSQLFSPRMQESRVVFLKKNIQGVSNHENDFSCSLPFKHPY